MSRQPLPSLASGEGVAGLRASRRTVRLLATAVVVASSLVAVVACVPSESGPAVTAEPGTSRTPSVPSTTPTATGEPEPSAEPTESTGRSIPVDIDCRALVSDATIYDLNPNLAADPAPRTSALAATVLANDGVRCGWINQSSGTPLSASVAAFDAIGWAAARDAVAARGGTAIGSGFGADGVFRQDQAVGVIELLRSPYWIVIESPIFASADEARLVIDAIVRALP